MFGSDSNNMNEERRGGDDGDGGDDDDRAGKILWVDKYSPRHFTELLSDDVRTWCRTLPVRG